MMRYIEPSQIMENFSFQTKKRKRKKRKNEKSLGYKKKFRKKSFKQERSFNKFKYNKFMEVDISKDVKQIKYEDIEPFCKKMLINNKIIVFGYCGDGHAGNRVTHIIDHLTMEEKMKIIDIGPKKWVDKLKTKCKDSMSGAMITAWRCQYDLDLDKDWVVEVASRGDTPLVVYKDNKKIFRKKDDLPYEYPDMKDPKIKFVPYSDNAVLWNMTKDKDIIQQFDEKSKKIKRPIYCQCQKTNRIIASFSVLGDSDSFSHIKTTYVKWKVESGSRIVCGSDGVFDVIHDEDDILTNKTKASEIVTEAYSRWTEQQFNVKKSLNPSKTCFKSKIPGCDDISCCVIQLS